MKKYVASLFFILVCCSLFSQTGFYNGFIIRLKGDTIQGVVYLSTDRNNLKKCIFKRFELAVPITLKASEIKAYGITGKRFFLSMEKNGKWEFVEVLVKGSYTLISDKGKFQIEKTGEPGIMLNKETIHQLAEKIPGKSNADTIEIKEENLILFTSRLNQLSGSPSEVLKKSASLSPLIDFTLSKNQLAIGIMSGVNIDCFSKISNSSSMAYYAMLHETKLKLNASFASGLYLKYQFITEPDLALVSDIIYIKRSLHGYFYDNNRLVWNDAFVDFSNVEVSLMLRHYNQGISKRFYYQVGGFYSILQKGTAQQYTDYQVKNYITSLQLNFPLNSDSYGPRAGIGIEKSIRARKIFVQLEGKYGMAKTAYESFNTPQKINFTSIQLQLILGINL